MIWEILVLVVLIICFGGVLFFGAPYLPTLTPQIKAALELADLKPGQTLLELGCGDGKVVIAAAKQGINVVGYELNPLLAALAWIRTRRYSKNTQIIWGDFWRQTWPPADAIFVFLLPKYMSKLNKEIINKHKQPIKLISFAFLIPDGSPDAEKAGVYLYKYS